MSGEAYVTGPGHVMHGEDAQDAVTRPAPPIRSCVECGRRVFTGARPPRCLDCIAGLRRPAPGSGLGDVLAVVGALFDG